MSVKEIDYIPVNDDLQKKISADWAWRYFIVPKKEEQSSFEFYIDELQQANEIQQELELLLGKNICLYLTPSQLIKNTLGKYYIRQQNTNHRVKQLVLSAGQDFLNELIKEARELNSSDIHIEADDDTGRVRFRVDGLLVDRYLIDKNEYYQLVNKIKVRSALDISEQRLPQDGRIEFSYKSMKFDIRVSVTPTIYGQSVVMRLLSNDTSHIDINGLGFSDMDLSSFLKAVKKSKGLVLITGPTGSGKTTTLYATLKLLNKPTRKLLTVEDPVEYTLKRVIQVPVNESIGLSFSRALRTFLRQDPDIIMLGEIRDEETAQIAVRASSTGHLVLSTIHANSAWGAIPRLIDIGIPAYHIADTLNITVAQRLLRKPCIHCSIKKEFDINDYDTELKISNIPKYHYVPIGCEACKMTGYSGRKAIYEVIPIDKELQRCIREKNFDVSDYLKEKKIKTLAENALELFEKGETTFEEIYQLLLDGC